MSKNLPSNSSLFASLLLILQFFTNSNGQGVEATIEMGKAGPQVLKVSGRFVPEAVLNSKLNFSFQTSIAGVDGVADRISSIELYGSRGELVSYRKLGPGEYLASAEYERWAYSVDLKPLRQANAGAHITWARGETGVLMMADLLPFKQQRSSPRIANIDLILPAGWRAFAENSPDRVRELVFEDLESAVIPIGPGWRSIAVSGTPGKLLLSGDWLFTDVEASRFVSEIYGEYRHLFRTESTRPFTVVLSRPGDNVPFGTWYAETRGRTVSIVSSDMAFRTQSLQRLHEQLRHELFHLWIPNGISLTGPYDWFYEGFALYQSLKTGLALNRIGFGDFLATLGRAHAIDTGQGTRAPLIEVSSNRWSGRNTEIYARGLIAAFRADIALLSESNGKVSIGDFLGEIYSEHQHPAPSTDANAAIFAAVDSRPGLRKVFDRFVRGKESIDLGEINKLAGIEGTGRGSQTGFKVAAKLTARQKAILDRLGYNNWRKLSREQK